MNDKKTKKASKPVGNVKSYGKTIFVFGAF